MTGFARPIGRRELIIGGTLGLTAIAGGAVTQAAQTEPRAIDPLGQIIPTRIGQWAEAPFGGLRLPQGETPQEGEYDQLLTRYYTSAVAPAVMLLIAYGGTQSGESSVHRPEICYPAAGFTMGASSQLAIAGPSRVRVDARTLVAYAPGRVEQLLYWCRIGQEFPTTDFDQRLAVLRNAVTGQTRDGALIRMSTIDPDAGSVAMLTTFAKAMLYVGDPRAQSLLIGQT